MFNKNSRKNFRRLMAFTMAATVTATSVAPASLQSVYAAEAVDDGNSFNTNVARGKGATITSPEVDTYKEGYLIGELTNGATTDIWESEKNQPMDEIVYDYEMTVDIDLEKVYTIDHIDVYWMDAVAPGAFQIQVSKNGADWTTVGEETEKVTSVESKRYEFEPEQARYVRLACTQTSAYNAYGFREIEVYTVGGLETENLTNHALGKTVVAQKEEVADTAARITDGTTTDKTDQGWWASGVLTEGETVYFYVDLGEEKNFNELKLYFEAACAKKYDIAIATDESAVLEENIANEELWTNVVSDAVITDNVTQLNPVHALNESVDARYVKFTAEEAWDIGWGVKVFEMEVIDRSATAPTESIYLDRTEDYIFDEAGDTVQLYAQVLPANADNKEVTWSTTDPEVATVDETGKVTAVGNGIATITATVAGDITASMKVMLLSKLNTPVVTAEKAEEDTVNVKWEAVEGATEYELYRIVDGVKEEEAIIVDAAGYTDEDVVAGNSYSYTVRAVAKEADVYTALSEWSTASDAVTIPLAVSGVSLDQNEAELVIKQGAGDKPTVKLTAAIEPEKATNKNVSWGSDNVDVATVDNGTVTAVGPGMATITVVTEDGKLSDTCEVTVYEQLAAPVVVAAQGEDGQSIALTWPEIVNADSYQIMRATGKNGEYEVLSVNAEDLVIEAGIVTYIDSIDENATGNTYTYKVAALPKAESYYTQSPDSVATKAIQVGQQSPFGVNVALGKPVKADSSKDNFDAENITDGGLTEADGYWESLSKEGEITDNLEYAQSVIVDLEELYTIDNVRIHWRTAAPASDYDVLVSADGEEYVNIGTGTEAAGGAIIAEDFPFAAQEVRYIKVDCKVAARWNCYSLMEIEAFTPGTVEEDDNTLTDLLISQDKAEMKTGQKLDLFAQKLPINAEEEVTWETSNDAIATVSNGKVTALEAGEVTITARAGEFAKTCIVSIKEQIATPENVTAAIAKDEKSITVSWDKVENADAYTLYKSVDEGEYTLVEDAEFVTGETSVSYTDEDVVAGVAYSYKVMASKEGELYLPSEMSKASASAIIPIYVENIALSPATAELSIGEELKLAAVITPGNATNQTVTWVSDAPAVVSVEDGVVTAKALGKATITATTEDGAKTATCVVTVNQKLAAPEVTAVKAEDDSSITITWAAVENAESYQVLRAVGKYGAYEELEVEEFGTTENGKLSYKDPMDLNAAGNTYSYKVVALPEEGSNYTKSDASEATEPIQIGESGAFGTNVASEKSVTVVYPEDKITDTTSENILKLVDGVIVAEDFWESTAKEDDGERVNRKADIVIDLEEKVLIDRVAVHWDDNAPAKEYKVYVSTDNTEWIEVGNQTDVPTTWDKNVAMVDHVFDARYARYVKIACEVPSAWGVYTINEIEVFTIGSVEEELSPNYALGKPVVAQKEESENFAASRITDGMKTEQMWSSGALEEDETVYFYVDLGEEKTFNEVKLYFEGACATKYDIAIATDESAVSEENIENPDSWTNIVTDAVITNNVTELNPDHVLEDYVAARYVKFTAKEPWYLEYGVKVYEMEVINQRDSIPAKNIYLNSTEDYIFDAIGDTMQLYAQILPINADAAVKWTSSNTDVATVENGMVTAVGKGVATITASVVGNENLKAEINVMYLDKLDTPTLIAEKTEDETVNVTWDEVEGASSYEMYRFVDGIKEDNAIAVNTNSYEDADVVAGNTYTYIVRAVATDADVYTALSDWSEESDKVTITLAAESVSIDKETAEITILPGTEVMPSIQLVATVEPEKATNKNVTWTSDNKAVATVEDGTVTAVAPGKATITVTTEDGELTDTCEVIVYEKLEAPVVEAVKAANGQSIVLNWKSVDNAGSYQILRAVGKSDEFEELAKVEASKVRTAGNFTYTDAIDANALGNTYCYKVIALPYADTYYKQSDASAATKKVQIGQQNPFGANVALNKPVTVTSEIDGCEAKHITDGGVSETDGWWESAKGQEGDTIPNLLYAQSIVIDLEEIYTIDNVRVHWRTQAPASNYDILVSKDGNTFTKVGESTEAANVGAVHAVDFPFEARGARYIKVDCKAALQWNCYAVVEVEAYTQGTVESEDATLTGLLISQETASVKLGQTLDLYAQKLPANATEEIIWESGDETVATVAGGKVTSVSAGVTTITATAGDKTVSCEVMVTEQLKTPEVSAVMAFNEKSITVSWNAVEKADAYTIYKSVDGGEYTAVEGAEYTVADTSVSYVDTAVVAGKSYSYKVGATSEKEYYPASATSTATDGIVIPIHVTGVTVDGNKVLGIGDTVTLTATVAPENATNKNVTWLTNKPEVATVENGVVTAVGVGEATISVITEDGEEKATCIITVNQQLEAPEITAVKAEDDSDITVSWEEVANAASYKIYRSVDGASFAEITGARVTAEDNVISYADTDLENGKTYSYKVVAVPEEFYLESESEATEAILIPIYVEGVALSKTTADLFVGDELTLEATINPEEATNPAISWKSSNEALATVEGGVVTAKAVGEVTISVITEDGEKTAECVIKIKKALDAPVVTATAKDMNMTISWKAVANAAGYDVFKSTDGKTFTKLTSVAATATSCEDKNLATGKYYYKVVAKGAGFYVDSAESSVATGAVTTVKVTGVTMQSAITINKGKTAVLTATVAPANATNKTVTWTSSNPAVATVVNGTVTAVAKGTATITATTADGSKTAVCTVTVDVPASKVTLNTKKIYIVKGKSIKIKATMAPSDTTDTLTWKSSKPSVATVKNGKIKAKKTGTTTITVTTSSGKKVTCKVFVVKKATAAKSIKLNKKKASIKVGNTLNLVPKVTPAKSTDFIKWKSSNKKIASVDAFGTVTAKKKGKVTITATTTSGKKVKCKVTVK